MKTFRNFSIKMKLSLGFGAMVLIALALGTAGWLGEGAVSEKAQMAGLIEEAGRNFQDCRRQEKNFELRGFAKYPGDTKNAEEKFAETTAEVTERLQKYGSSDLDKEEKEIFQKLQSGFKDYAAGFAKVVEARKLRDASLGIWKKTGEDLISASVAIKNNIVDPAVKSAQASRNADEINRWISISWSFNEDFLQPFTLMRVRAAYFLGLKDESLWEEFLKQQDAVTAGLKDFGVMIEGYDTLASAVAKLNAPLKQYEAAGVQYHQAVVTEREVNAELVKFGRAAAAVFEKLLEDINADLTAFSKKVSMILAVLSVVGGK